MEVLAISVAHQRLNPLEPTLSQRVAEAMVKALFSSRSPRGASLCVPVDFFASFLSAASWI